MRELPRLIFDIYALAFPKGHGFGRKLPVGAWQSDDGIAFGVITRDVDTHQHGMLIMQQQVDGVDVCVKFIFAQNLEDGTQNAIRIFMLSQRNHSRTLDSSHQTIQRCC